MTTLPAWVGSFPTVAPGAANLTTHTDVTLRLTWTSKAITKEATKEPIHAITPLNQSPYTQTTKTELFTSATDQSVS